MLFDLLPVQSLCFLFFSDECKDILDDPLFSFLKFQSDSAREILCQRF